MISGATQIIGGVPGRYLDPFLLVQSQQTGFHGVVTVAYAGEKPTFDLLFASSDQIRESAHLTEAYRILTTIRTVRERYLILRTDSGTRIYLHEMPSDNAQRFLATFRYQPSVRLKLGTLTMKQLFSVLVATQGRNGLRIAAAGASALRGCPESYETGFAAVRWFVERMVAARLRPKTCPAGPRLTLILFDCRTNKSLWTGRGRREKPNGP